MADEIAGLSLKVDVSGVAQAAKSLDDLAQSASRATSGVEPLVNELEVAKVKARQANEENKKMASLYKSVQAAIDPTVTRIQQLTKAADDLDKAWSAGAVPDAEFFRLGSVLETQISALKRTQTALTEEGRAALAESQAKEKAANAGQSFLANLQKQANQVTMTKEAYLEWQAAQHGVSAEAAPFIQQLTKQTNQMNLAGISAGQYKNAMRQLPAQITDVVTSLAGGQPVWLVAIQQGGQIKDSFGGIGNTLKILMGYLNPFNVGIGLAALGFGALFIAVEKSKKAIAEANTAVKDGIGITGNAANELALNIRNIAEESNKSAADVAKVFISTKDGATEAISKLVDIGYTYDEAAQKVEQYKNSSNFTQLNTDIENHQLKINGLKNAWSDAAQEVKEYYNGVNQHVNSNVAFGGGQMSNEQRSQKDALDVQKQTNDLWQEHQKQIANTVSEMQKQYLQVDRVAAAEKALADARKQDLVVQSSGNKEAIAQSNALIKARQRELEEAKKAEAKRNNPKKKTSTRGTPAAPTEQYDTELTTLQAQLTVLKEHATINDKISSQRQSLWATEAKIQTLEAAQGKRKLSTQEQSLLLNKNAVLELAKQKAELGDAVLKQKEFNERQDSSVKYVQQQDEQTKALAKSQGLSTKEMQRQAELAKLQSDWLAKGGSAGDIGLQEELAARRRYYDQEDANQKDWLGGAKQAFQDWGESASNMYQNVGNVATSALNGLSDQLTTLLSTGKANFADFTKSILSMILKMIIQMAIFNALAAVFGGGSKTGSTPSGAYTNAASGLQFYKGGYTGDGGKYEPKGVVHGGEFVFTKEATSRIGVGNLNKMMRGYASGGVVGGTSGVTMNSGGGAAGINLNIGDIGVNVNGGGASNAKNTEAGVRAIVRQMLADSCAQGGEVYTYVNSKV